MAAAVELFTREEIERGRRYHRPLYASLALDTALTLALLALLTFTSFGDLLQRPLAPLPWPLEVPLFAAATLAVTTVARLPLAYWRGHVRERRWGLSTQSARGWAADQAKGFAVVAVVTGGALAGLFGLIHLFPRAWPVVAAAAAAAFVFALTFLAPVVLEPIFNRFEPLRDAELAERLRRLAERAGAPVREVLVADASRRTRKVNAYVSGIGASRRVVVYDTLLERAERGEIEAVVAHELGHRRERHVVKLTLLGMAGTAGGVVVLWLLLRSESLLAAAGASGPGDPRAVPLVLLASTVLELAAWPLLAALSRRWERVADRLALELTNDPEACESTFRRLSAANVSDLDPPALVYLLLFAHPTIPERIAAVRRFGTVPA